MEDLTGKQLNQYQIVSPLGEGGMAAVYKAYQPSMERYVALKILPRHFASDPQFVGRFEQEAKVIASLQHPHILPVFDYGETDGYTFIVMPFVETGTLSDLLLGNPLPLDQIRLITAQIGDALDYAHLRGIVHRDIKPSNILIDERGNCILADFGIAKMVEGTTEFTQTGGIIGTPAYMSPEQGLGDKPDGRSDIYSLGIILYEMATGRTPYQAETPMAIVIKHIHDPLLPPRSVNPQISEALERVILKALAKSRVDRYSTCAEFVQAIQNLTADPLGTVPAAVKPLPALATLIEASDATTPPVMIQPPAPAPPPPASPTVEPSQQKTRWIPWAVATVGIFGIGVIAILMIWFIFLNGPNDEAATVLLVPTPTTIEILQPTQTATSVPEIFETPPSTETPTQTLEPTLGIGATLLSPIDESVLVFIPAGEFIMGAADNDPNADADELPQKTIFVDAFWMDQFEVTNRQYQTCVNSSACPLPADAESATRYNYYGDAEFEDYPVINVTWLDASTYCQWRGARLPTEAEWEKAARGDSGYLYPWGNTFEPMHSNYCASTILCPDEPEDGYIDTAPVGSFAEGVSPYGVHDMAGNINEWVADWYDVNYFASLTDGFENPTGPESGEERSIRGGSFGLNATKLRTTNRGSAKPTAYGPYGGFRCAQTP